MNASWTRNAAIALVVSAGLMLTNCATLDPIVDDMRGKLGLNDDPYLSDKSDICYSQRVALSDKGSTFFQDMVAGAVAASAMAALGAAMSGGDARQVATAAAFAGLAGGYMVSLQRQQQNPTLMARTAISDMQAENANIERTTVAFNNLVNCRKAEAATINQDLRAGRIGRSTAEERMAMVRAKFREDLNKASQINQKIVERSDGFVTVHNQFAVDNGQKVVEVTTPTQGAAPVVKTVPPPKQPPIQSEEVKSVELPAQDKPLVGEKMLTEVETNVKNRGAFADDIEDAETVASAGFSLDEEQATT